MGRDLDETWAPVPNAATTRALFAMAAADGLVVHHVDVKTAFLNAKIDNEVYIKLPDGVEAGNQGEMCRLNQALYGTKQPGRRCVFKLDEELQGIGALRNLVDPCLYEWDHPAQGRVVILVYVDDLIIAGDTLKGIQAVKDQVAANFEVCDMGEVEDFIGIKVMRDREAKIITLSNPGHTAALFASFGMAASTPNKTPMASGTRLTKTKEDLLLEGNRYADLGGSLLYLSTMTRPDIIFAVGVLSRFMSCPEQGDMRAAKGVLRYSHGTVRLGVVYGATEPLRGSVDAHWAGDVDSRRSTTGLGFILIGGPVS